MGLVGRLGSEPGSGCGVGFGSGAGRGFELLLDTTDGLGLGLGSLFGLEIGSETEGLGLNTNVGLSTYLLGTIDGSDLTLVGMLGAMGRFTPSPECDGAPKSELFVFPPSVPQSAADWWDSNPFPL